MNRRRKVPSIEHGIGTFGPAGLEKGRMSTGDNVELQAMFCELHMCV